MIALHRTLALAAMIRRRAAASESMGPEWTTAVALAERIKAGQPTQVLDLRSAEEFQRFHVPSAVPATLGDLIELPSPRSASIVVYGDDRAGRTSLGAASDSGYRHVAYLRQGLYEWIARVHEPALPVDATPAERAEFDRLAALSRYFGGQPRWTCRAPPPRRLLDGGWRHRVASVGGDRAPRGRDPEARMLMRAVDRVACLRAKEFARLDRTATAYLDYTGAALYPASLVRREMRRLQASVRGNPHADSGPSAASTAATDRARALTLEFAGADPAVYDVVFTANASGAIRILAEAFPFDRNSRLVLTADNHNSVNGTREYARLRGARVHYLPLDDNLRLRTAHQILWQLASREGGLFAFPAQSNFSGVRHPLEWIGLAQARGYRVLLDAASFAPGARLDLGTAPADFVALSYYKIFGYPTGVGALIARRDALAELQRRYFGGGTVDYVSMPHRLAQRKEGWRGSRTAPSAFSLRRRARSGSGGCRGLGMDAVGRHTASMTERLLEACDAPERPSTSTVQLSGGARRDGGAPCAATAASCRWKQWRPPRDLGIAIRGGCFCIPGGRAPWGSTRPDAPLPARRLQQRASASAWRPAVGACAPRSGWRRTRPMSLTGRTDRASVNRPSLP